MNNVKSLREVGLRPRASASLLFSQGSSSNSGDSWLDRGRNRFFSTSIQDWTAVFISHYSAPDGKGFSLQRMHDPPKWQAMK